MIAKLPLWKCNGAVGAAPITGVRIQAKGGANLDYIGRGGLTETVKVSVEYMNTYFPMVGGYYIATADGVQAYAEAEAFEAMFTPLRARGPYIKTEKKK